MNRNSYHPSSTVLWIRLCALTALAIGCQQASGHEAAGTASAEPLSNKSAPLPSAQAARPAERVALERDCRSICQRSVDLRCKNTAECLPNCVGMGSVLACEQAFAAFYRCLQTQPLANWRCDEDGVAAIREGFCDHEQEDAIACMNQNTKP